MHMMLLTIDAHCALDLNVRVPGFKPYPVCVLVSKHKTPHESGTKCAQEAVAPLSPLV